MKMPIKKQHSQGNSKYDRLSKSLLKSSKKAEEKGGGSNQNSVKKNSTIRRGSDRIKSDNEANSEYFKLKSFKSEKSNNEEIKIESTVKDGSTGGTSKKKKKKVETKDAWTQTERSDY